MRATVMLSAPASRFPRLMVNKGTGAVFLVSGPTQRDDFKTVAGICVGHAPRPYSGAPPTPEGFRLGDSTTALGEFRTSLDSATLEDFHGDVTLSNES